MLFMQDNLYFLLMYLNINKPNIRVTSGSATK